MFLWLSAIGSIIFVDLILSADNALVIGAAASGLKGRNRLLAIAFGGGGAVVLRIVFATIATFLLQMPLLQAIGGVLLIYIALRLLFDRSKDRRKASEDQEKRQDEKGFFASLLTILVADVSMSLDNVLAVGALASGHISLLIIGLLVSVALLLAGSALVAELIGRLPWLLDVASLILVWTGANMILNDVRLGPFFDSLPWTQFVIPSVAIGIAILADLYLWRRDSRKVVVKR